MQPFPSIVMPVEDIGIAMIVVAVVAFVIWIAILFEEYVER